MRKVCQFGFSDGAECLKPAKANIGTRWFCAEHYDNWLDYYRHLLSVGGTKFMIAEAKRVLREHK